MNNNKKKKVTIKNAHTTDMDGTNKKDEKYERSVSLTLFTCIQTLFDFQTLATSASRRPSSHKYPRSHRFRFRIQFFSFLDIYFSRTWCVVVYFSLLFFFFFYFSFYQPTLFIFALLLENQKKTFFSIQQWICLKKTPRRNLNGRTERRKKEIFGKKS